jgi:hypothetical protein
MLCFTFLSCKHELPDKSLVAKREGVGASDPYQSKVLTTTGR